MDRKLVTVRTVAEIHPIEGADFIEMAVVDGWQCVVKKGEFKVGDKGVYFEIDSFLPAEDERFAFLEKNFITWEGHYGARIRTIRLKKQISQGLLLPLVQFPEAISQETLDGLGVIKWEGTESSEGNQKPRKEKTWLQKLVYKIAKKARHRTFKPLFDWLEGKYPNWFKNAPNGFPAFIPKTDEERIQNIFNRIKLEEENNPSDWEVSIKLDGSSMTVYHNNGKVGVCSRNIELDERDGGNFWDTAKDCGLTRALDTYGRNIAIQGELMGPGIQGNRENLKTFAFYVYKIYDIDGKCFLSTDERYEVLDDLGTVGEASVEHVPILSEHKSFSEFPTIAHLLQYAEGPSINASKREGLVFKRMDGGRSFKVISNSYLLKHGE